MVVLPLLVHVKGFTGGGHLWVLPFFSHVCPTCLVPLTRIFFMMGGQWPYSWYLVGCCLQELFNNARSILVELTSIFSIICLVTVNVMHPYINIYTTTAWKKQCFILSVWSDFHKTDSRSIAVHPFGSFEFVNSWLMRHCFLGWWTFLNFD